MFYELFEKACAEIGVAPTRLLIDLGIGKSAAPITPRLRDNAIRGRR